ncbi:MAG: hypothetical protein COB17_01980 [Sulfurimonas sp.]|nr:MAG: hypothetical protein COB17_01980 [Sulfurimonas sp.]
MYKFFLFTVFSYIVLYASSYFIQDKELSEILTCEQITSKDFVANYEISTPDRSALINYYRLGKKVAYEYRAQEITEIWKKNENNQVQLIRAFDNHKRSIEYKPVDTNIDDKYSIWGIHKNLATPELFHLTNASVSKKDGCVYKHYEQTSLGKDIVMEYEKNNNILLSLEVKKDNEILYSYKLKNIKGIDKKENHLNEALEYDSLKYDTTDVAEIEDKISTLSLQKNTIMLAHLQ